MDYVRGNALVPYVAMRSVSALLGALLVPLSFLTMLGACEVEKRERACVRPSVEGVRASAHKRG